MSSGPELATVESPFIDQLIGMHFADLVDPSAGAAPAAAPTSPRTIGKTIHLRRALITERPHGSYCASIGVSTSYSFICVQPVLHGRVPAAG